MTTRCLGEVPSRQVNSYLSAVVRAAIFFSLQVTILLFTGKSLFCEQRALKTDVSENIDAVLLLDSSGSMRLTDPNRLRDEGSKLFIQFLKKGDRVAVIEFSSEAKVVSPLSESSSDSSKDIAGKIAKISNEGLYTDLLSGLRAAAKMLEANHRSNASPVILLLSDGKMEPDPARGAAQALTNEIFNSDLPELKAKGIKVHTLSFSTEADREILSQIAAATDGLAMFTPTSEKIHESFASLFLAVKKPQVLPLTSKGFKIDEDVQEATFYINKGEEGQVAIESPSGLRTASGVDNEKIKWFKGQKFDVVTIANPEPGDWKIHGLPSGDSFATVLTNLKLVTDWPSTATAEEETLLQARLYESDKPVVLQEMTDSVAYAFQITPTDKVSEPVVREELHDDGKNGDKLADDGIFTAAVKLKDVGEYTLKVVAHAPTFDRYQHIPFRVKPRLLTLTIRKSAENQTNAAAHAEGHADHDTKNSDTASDDGNHDDSATHGKTDASHDTHGLASHGDAFVAHLSPEARDLKDVELSIIAIDSERTRYEIPMKAGENALEYEVPVAVLKKEGSYKVQAMLEARGKNRRVVKFASDILDYMREVEPLTPDSIKVTMVEEAEHKSQPVETKPGIVFPLLIVTVINLVGAALVFLLMQKSGSGPVVALPSFGSIDEATNMLQVLAKKADLTEVDLTDPIFSSKPASYGSTSSGDASIERINSDVASQETIQSEASEAASETEATQDSEAEQATT